MSLNFGKMSNLGTNINYNKMFKWINFLSQLILADEPLLKIG
jgi:hypothetical protein